MQLLAVELVQFRNIRAALVEPHARFNVLHGDNGQGKTNFLEAVDLLGTLRSFRASRLEELVLFGAAHAQASARVERNGLERRYDVTIHHAPARKVARVDGKASRSTTDYFGGFNIVLFVPDDLRLPRGSPSSRRRFLDRAIWNVEPTFLATAQIHERLLRSRNALLKDRGPLELLDVYDEQLAIAGAALSLSRARYIRALEPRVRSAFERISRSGLSLDLRYLSSVEAGARDGNPGASESAAIAGALLSLLGRNRPRDKAVGYTTSGPHTDDLEILLDHRPARIHASQGQLRAIVLALKVAEIQHLAAMLGEPPILLLDDVSSELDRSRNAFLFEFLEEVSGQVFITTTDPSHVPSSSERRDFRVSGGELTPIFSK